MDSLSRSLLSLFLLLSLPAISSVVALLRPPVNLPSISAEKLIRDLNLFPNLPINVVDDDTALLGGPSLVERPLRFPNLFDSDGISTEDLCAHAGYYKIEHSHAARMFYFFFKSRNGSSNDPVVIWLTGGPGCSSELALFYENGPYKIANNLSLVRNEYGWDQVSNLLFVDQPTGTGFSYSSDRRDIRHDERGVSNDLYGFIQAFFKEHPKLAKRDFYITGESYAGHYIPAFAARVHQGNKANEGIHVNLKGFAIGNGLTDPAIQYAAYADYALEMKLIDESGHRRANRVLPLCERAIKLCGTDGKLSCLAAFVVCNTIFNSIKNQIGGKNYYDIRKQCIGQLCYDFSNMEKFLEQKEVREALGVGDMQFVSCSPTVYQAMITDWMKNLEVGIPELLEDGVKLLVYAGEYDLICNWLGNSRWVNAMEWSGQKEFIASPEAPFNVSDVQAGVIKSFGPLTFLKVHDAGHMVPMDQPKAALEMLKRWMESSPSEVESVGEAESLVSSM